MAVRKWAGEARVTGDIDANPVTQDKGWDVTNLSDGGYLVTWIDQSLPVDRIFAQRFNAMGETNGASFEVGASVVGLSKTTVTVTSLTNGGFVFGFTNGSGAQADAWFERYDAAGALQQTTQWDNFGAYTTTEESDVAITRFGSGFLLVEYDAFDQGIWVQRRDSTGTIVNLNGLQLLEVTPAAAGIQRSPSIAGYNNDQNFVVAWFDDNTTDYKMQLYTASGTAVGGPQTIRDVDSTGDGDFAPQVVGLANGGFVAVWHENTSSGVPDTNFYSVRAQMYDNNGAAVGSIIQVNSRFANLQARMDVVATRDGGFFVTFDDESQGGDRNISGQLFDAFGNRVGAQVIVNTTTAGFQYDSRLALLDDGRIAVIWAESGVGIRQQILDPRDGIIFGTEGANTLYGHDLFSDEINGLGGSDNLYGLGGNDFLAGVMETTISSAMTAMTNCAAVPTMMTSSAGTASTNSTAMTAMTSFMARAAMMSCSAGSAMTSCSGIQATTCFSGKLATIACLAGRAMTSFTARTAMTCWSATLEMTRSSAGLAMTR